MSEGWQTVSSGKKRGKRGKKRTPAFSALDWRKSLQQEDEQFAKRSRVDQAAEVEALVQSINLTKEALRVCLDDDTWNAGLDVKSCFDGWDTLDQPRIDIVCYGVGRFASSAIARTQMAFGLLLHEKTPQSGSISLYEPMLSQAELRAAEELKVHLIEHNEQGKRAVQQPTLFYMPHCAGALYNNVVWANWGADLNRFVAILGNSFEEYLARLPRGKLVPALQRVFPHTSEVKLSLHRVSDVKLPMDKAFNDLSIHSFRIPKAMFVDQPTEFIPDSAQDSELI